MCFIVECGSSCQRSVLAVIIQEEIDDTEVTIGIMQKICPNDRKAERGQEVAQRAEFQR